MDNGHFDSLTRGLATGDSRRRLLAFLGALPVAGGLAALLDPADAEAAGRRKRRKKRHKHGDDRRRKKRKHRKKPNPPTCTPEPRAQTCDGACGEVSNNCGIVVDCGPCPCSPTCAACQTCQGGSCVEDPARTGTCCNGADGVCAGGVCTPCDAFPNSVCDQVTGACVCTATCTGKACGADDGCGGICATGSCPADQTCQPNGACLQNLNQFQCLCGDSTTPSGCVRAQCRAGFDTVCSGYCTNHRGYYGLGTPGTGCGPGACTP